jgi:polysaccharide pyruvyl transferase WcaK-like protein
MSIEHTKSGVKADPRLSPERCQTACPRIALLTPYNGGNLGDAVIQDAVIANMRVRLPHVQFTGISLSNETFTERHRVAAFALRGTAMERGMLAHTFRGPDKPTATVSEIGARLKRALKGIPVLGSILKGLLDVCKEVGHCFRAYSFIKTQDLLLISGGGQLCDRWGGAWRHPFALFKWGLLARIAAVPYAIASVGASPTQSATSRFFMSATLRMADYRSFRDEESKATVNEWMSRAHTDAVVSDLALSLPSAELPSPLKAIREKAKGRKTIALSVIAYAKPGLWPTEDRTLFERYVREMQNLVRQLVDRDYFVAIVWSSCGDDESVVSDILNALDGELRKNLTGQIDVASIATWRDLVATLRAVDCVIASRLHSMILSFICGKPAIAISFDSKVDCLMAGFDQADYLLQIADFTAGNVISALGRLEINRQRAVEQISFCQNSALPALKAQYDRLIQLALMSSLQRGQVTR